MHPVAGTGRCDRCPDGRASREPRGVGARATGGSRPGPAAPPRMPYDLLFRCLEPLRRADRRDTEVGHGLTRLSAVPVTLVWLAVDDIALADGVLLGPIADTPLAFHDDQDLLARMHMPVGARAVLE